MADILKEWTVRPWADMFDLSQFVAPKPNEVSSRIENNVQYYKTNYFCIFLFLIGAFSLSHPFFLLTLLISGALAFALFSIKNLSFQGKNLGPVEKLGITVIATLILMWLTGSASYVFYTLVFTGAIVGGHCYMRKPTLKAKATNLVSDIASGIKQDISDVETKAKKKVNSIFS